MGLAGGGARPSPICDHGAMLWRHATESSPYRCPTAVVLAGTLLLLLVPAPARADAPRLQLDPVTDSALIAGSAGLALSLQLVLGTDELAGSTPADPARLRPIDRRRARSDRRAGGHISDIAAGALMGYALVDVLRMALGDRQEHWATYPALYLETASITLALTNLFKIAVRRPRPSAYIEEREAGAAPTDTESYLSFFSGHSALSFGLASTAIYLAALRGDSTEAWVVGLGTSAVALTVAIRRVTEARHFPTDVIAGAVVGAAIGTLVPHLHLRRRQSGATGSARINVAPEVGRRSAGVAMSGVF